MPPTVFRIDWHIQPMSVTNSGHRSYMYAYQNMPTAGHILFARVGKGRQQMHS